LLSRGIHCFKGTHNLPITTFVQPTYYRFGPLFSLRAHMAEARLGSSDSFTKHCMTGFKNIA